MSKIRALLKMVYNKCSSDYCFKTERCKNVNDNATNSNVNTVCAELDTPEIHIFIR